MLDLPLGLKVVVVLHNLRTFTKEALEYTCIYTAKCINIIYLHIHKYIWLYTYSTYLYTYIHVYTCIYIYVCMYVCVYMYMYIYICMYIEHLYILHTHISSTYTHSSTVRRRVGTYNMYSAVCTYLRMYNYTLYLVTCT